MSFVMIAAGPTSCSRVRTVSIRALFGASALAALVLVSAGAGLGWWLSILAAPVAATPPVAPSTLPFAVEQLGTLSGRLFKLESLAGRLRERIGVMQQDVAPEPAARARPLQADAGGPMLPPRREDDGLAALEVRLLTLGQQIEIVAAAASLQNVALMRLPTRVPVSGADLASGFGNRDDPITGRRAFHGGLDFAAAAGTAIHAAAGGAVAFAGIKPDFGRVVDIDHGNGLITRYAHASKLWVKTGDFVAPGDLIAEVGSTGRSTGAHLHFEVLRNGEAVDPRRFLAGL